MNITSKRAAHDALAAAMAEALGSRRAAFEDFGKGNFRYGNFMGQTMMAKPGKSAQKAFFVVLLCDFCAQKTDRKEMLSLAEDYLFQRPAAMELFTKRDLFCGCINIWIAYNHDSDSKSWQESFQTADLDGLKTKTIIVSIGQDWRTSPCENARRIGEVLENRCRAMAEEERNAS